MILKNLTPSLRGSLFYLLYWGAASVYDPFFSVYFIEKGFSNIQIGLLWSLFPLITLLVSPVVGFIADSRKARVLTLTVLLIGFIPAFFALNFANTFIMALLLTAITALFRGPSEPLADSVIARMSVHYKIDYGRMRLWGSLSYAVGAILFGILWERFGYAWMFVVAALFAIPIILSALTLEETHVERKEKQKRPFEMLRQDRVLVILMVTCFLHSFALSMGQPFAGVYMADLGGSAVMVSAIFAIAALFELPTMHYAQNVIRRYSGANALVFAYLCTGIAYAGYAFIREPIILLCLAVFKGLGFGLFFVAVVHVVNERVPHEWASTALGVVLGVATLGVSRVIGSQLSGFLYEASSVWLFSSCAALAFVAAAIVFLSRRAFNGQ
jgi:MFS transporter, PPP family, 3-phenylpropionic acid transporter